MSLLLQNPTLPFPGSYFFTAVGNGLSCVEKNNWRVALLEAITFKLLSQLHGIKYNWSGLYEYSNATEQRCEKKKEKAA